LISAALSICATASTVTAQSTPSPLPPPEAGSPAAKPDPERHLSDAQTRLSGVSPAALPAEGKKKLSQLREDMAQLQASYRDRAASTHRSSASSAASDNKDKAASDSKEKSASDWNLKFSDVERDLAGILGAGSSLATGSTTAVAANVSGASPGTTPSTAPAAGANDPASPRPGTTAAPTPQAAAGSGRGATATTGIDAGDRVIVNGAATLPGAPPTGSNPAGTGTSTTQATGASAPTAATQTVTPQSAAVDAGANGGVVGVVDVTKIGVKNLDPQVRVELEQVRTSLELFYDAAKRVTHP